MDDDMRASIQRAITALTMVDEKTSDPRLGDLVHGMAEELHEFMVEEGGIDEAQN